MHYSEVLRAEQGEGQAKPEIKVGKEEGEGGRLGERDVCRQRQKKKKARKNKNSKERLKRWKMNQERKGN